MRKHIFPLAAVAALALLTPACGDLTTSRDQLTDDEAAYLADQFAATALDGVSAGMAGSPSTSASAMADAGPPITWERTFTMTRPCPAGGTVTHSSASSGTMDSETHSGTVEVTHTLTMDDCARTRGEVTITVNTDPSIVMTGTITVEHGQQTTGSFTKTGAFVWETSDGRSGRCEINLSITWNADGSRTVEGTMCGKDITREHTRRQRDG